MRVLRYIVRFLGISYIILWLLSAIVRADDVVTVNFPDEMTVTGSVSINNLGLTGDPQPNDAVDFPSLVDEYRNADVSKENPIISSTYILRFKEFNFLKLGTSWYGDVGGTLFTFKVPEFNFAKLKYDFASALYGESFGSTAYSPVGQKIFPSLTGGRSNLSVTSPASGSTVVTDQIGNGTWSMNFNWRYFSGLSLPSPAGGYDLSAWAPSTFRHMMSIMLRFLAWYEVTYLIITKVSKA